MSQEARKRQQRIQHQNAKRKDKQRQVMQRTLIHRAPALAKTSSWPLHEVLLTQTWRDTEHLTQILVSRQGPAGKMAIGVFLVDLGCLGVKTAYGRVTDDLEYEDTKRAMSKNQRLIRTDVNLVAKIVREAIAYARQLGFSPDPDYRQAMIVLGDANPDACEIEVPLGGQDGKPFYFAGPFDNWQLIVGQLMKKLGPNGFNYVAPIEEDQIPTLLRGRRATDDAGPNENDADDEDG